MRVLVTFGSKRGGTEGLAQMVTADLREQGLTVDLLPSGQIHGLDGREGEGYERVL